MDIGAKVPMRVVRVLWDLEARGATLTMGDDGKLQVSPSSLITPHDRQVLTQHRLAARAFVRWWTSATVQ